MGSVRSLVRLAALFVLGICIVSPALAQFRSCISVSVTYSSGAVVVDAQVTLTNVDTCV